MHVALNAWFWNRPDTGSGQYVRRLVGAFESVAPDLKITLIAPEDQETVPPSDRVHVKTIPLRGSGHLAKFRFEQNGFPQAAAEVGADLAHVPYWGSPLNSPIPIVVTVHDLIPLLLPEYRGGVLARLYTGMVAAAARGAAAVITDSRASGLDIAEHLHIDPDNIFPIHLAAGEDFHPRDGSLVDMAIRKKYDLPPGEFLLYLGGYDVRKNVDGLLRAFNYVRKGYDIPMVLAGRPPTSQSRRFTDVHALIEAYEMADSVHVIGEVDDDDLPAMYRLAKTFVFPSRYEGFGLPVLEAMSCGTPVVTSDTSSLPEIVEDAAFAIDPDDARHIAGAIISTLTQPQHADNLRQKGLERAKEFSWERTAAETVAVYRKALEVSSG